MALPHPPNGWTDDDSSIPSIKLSAEVDELLREFEERARRDKQRRDPSLSNKLNSQSGGCNQGQPAQVRPRRAESFVAENVSPAPQTHLTEPPRVVRVPRIPAQISKSTIQHSAGSLRRDTDSENQADTLAAREKPRPVLLPTTVNSETSIQDEKYRKRNYFTINGNQYKRLDCIGRGGTSRVYRVLREQRILAVKRVDLANVDDTALRGYKNEILLLKKLAGLDRVVNLLDWELRNNHSALYLLMEFGQLDFNKLLQRQIGSEDAKLDINFTRYYWREMVECVASVHDIDIVHSDLKPANFVSFGDRLKLIDFGIANLIDDGTVNVHRDHQVGTPGYMAPEALLDTRSQPGSLGIADKLVKLGKPSDIWSLGCILYQMTYGKAPFAHLQGHLQRALAIVNPEYPISYPEAGIGGVVVPPVLLKTIRACLNRRQHERPTVKDLLSPSNPLLYPDLSEEGEVNMTREQLHAILHNVVGYCDKVGPPTDTETSAWSKEFLEKLREMEPYDNVA